MVGHVKPAFAPAPEVRNVVPYDNSGSTFLNITVWHNVEIPDHYVNIIEVINGANTTDLTIGVQNLAPDGTFFIIYDLGPTLGNPQITVKAHCTVNNWSITNWTGQVPEYQMSLFLLALILTTSIAILAFRRIKQ